MANRGTKEAKRARRAAPPTLEKALPVGCGLALGIYLGACLALWTATNRLQGDSKFEFMELLVQAFSFPALLIVGYGFARYVYGLGLLLAVQLTWSRRGLRCLVVHSNSPAWEEHVRTAWLPRFGHLAVALNWTERASWRPTLAVRVFRRFCGERNFNPAVVVFRGLRQPHVFRFFYAFKEAAGGRQQYLQHLEAELFDVLGVEGAA